MGAQEPGEKRSLFHAGTKSSGGPPRSLSGCLCWFMAAGAPQKVLGAEWADLNTPCKEAQDSQLGLGAEEAAGSSPLCAGAAKAQGSGGVWHCWVPPVTLALHRSTHSTGGKDRQVSCIHPTLPTRSTAKEEQSSRLGQSSGDALSQQEGEGAAGRTYQAPWAPAQSVCVAPGAAAGRTAAHLQGSSGAGSSPRRPP